MSATAAQPRVQPGARWLSVDCPLLEIGAQRFPRVTLAGVGYGQPVGDAPVTVVMGEVSASPWAFGGGGAAGFHSPAWWPALVGPGLLDLARETVLCPAPPGRGTSWAGLDSAHDLSVLDLADLLAAWLDMLGVERSVRFVGASVGGLVGLALAASFPHRVHRVVAISTGSQLRDGAGAFRSPWNGMEAEVAVVGVPGDRLFPWEEQQALHAALQGAGVRSSLVRFESTHGHDAFQADQDRLADLLRRTGSLAGLRA